MFLKGGHLPPSTLKFGAIIGAATVDDCYLYGKATSGGTSLWHEFGKVGWYLSNAILFDKHIPYRGQLGLFPVPIHVIADVTCNGKPVELKAGDAQ